MNKGNVFALPCKCNLEDLVSSYERSQSGQTLFAWTPNTHQQGVPSRCPDYPWHLRKQRVNNNSNKNKKTQVGKDGGIHSIYSMSFAVFIRGQLVTCVVEYVLRASHQGRLSLKYLDQMYHGVLKEDHVHASTPNALIVMAQEHVQTLL